MSPARQPRAGRTGHRSRRVRSTRAFDAAVGGAARAGRLRERVSASWALSDHAAALRGRWERRRRHAAAALWRRCGLRQRGERHAVKSWTTRTRGKGSTAAAAAALDSGNSRTRGRAHTHTSIFACATHLAKANAAPVERWAVMAMAAATPPTTCADGVRPSAGAAPHIEVPVSAERAGGSAAAAGGMRRKGPELEPWRRSRT